MIIALQALLFFREKLFTVIERFLRPYYQNLTLRFKNDENSDDEESDEHVFAEYDDVKGVVFYPPVYAQRYAAVSDCLMDERWSGKLEKVVDFGYHDMSFIKYLKDVPGIKNILGVDIDTIPLQCSSDLLGCDNYIARRENPLKVTLFQGNAADPDYRLIGCDAVVAIEMIEHMLPHDLERLIHTVFGFIKPWVAIFTTPNGDFNVLFKALEKNGLRRLDHMFEWTREQYHDWCSNIVARYPEYTVTCRGIGPGPPDTLHLGCCSQLALFVAKNYTKQLDLDLNSFALVAKRSSPNDLSHIISSWDSPDSTMENNMLCALPSVESYPDLDYEESSCMTIVVASAPLSLISMEYQDKILQCNLDSEYGKNFLMFDDEVYFNIVMPRPEKHCRIYEIEDVASRLNCSTFHMKKFSKKTQSLMAKNKMEAFAHTRDVVNEIRHLAKMLNFNKDHVVRDFEGTWCNINWGVNAPYWNQYYRIVREYTYPFEVKTDETRILDLIIEEINRIIDADYEHISLDMQKLEIPIDQLMGVVEHITTDVDQVKELLEWNGYEVVGDLVIHSRLIVENISDLSQDDQWQDDSLSDWDATDVRSTSFSDGSTIVPDNYGHRLRRAIDQKVRKLRTLLTVDNDITIELDRVVCRLMKLSLCMSKGRQNPPPISWMQCKLFDLLTLTEKAIERRRLQKFSLKAIEYHKDISNLDDIKVDFKRDQIVSKYQNLDLPPDLEINGDLQIYDSDFDDYNISIANNEFEGIYVTNKAPNIEKCDKSLQESMMIDSKEFHGVHKIEFEETGRCNQDLVPYPSYRSTTDLISSSESSCSTSNGGGKKQNELEDKTEISSDNIFKINESEAVKKHKQVFPKKRSKAFGSKHNIHKTIKTKMIKKVSSRRPSYLNLLKYDSFEYMKYILKERKTPKDHQMLQSTTSRPIPASLIELCNSRSNKNLEKLNSMISNTNTNKLYQANIDIAATEEFMFIGIVTEEGEETIAMRRHIGVSPELDLEMLENEVVLEPVINLTQDDSFYCKPIMNMENVQSQIIFLNDLDEPSTSKGIRHLSTDVQCGPDMEIASPMFSQINSFTKTPKERLFTKGIKIGEPTNLDTNIITKDFGTYTEFCDSTVANGRKSIGIKIEESIHDKTITTTPQINNKTDEFSSFEPRSKTKLLQPVSSTFKIVDLGSEFCESVGCDKSPTQVATPSKNTSETQIQYVGSEKNVVTKTSQASHDITNLVCGGIHVHSFKEKYVSEDVVYQGEWQKKQHISTKKRSSVIKKSLTLPKRQTLRLEQNLNANDTKKITMKPKAVTNPKSTIKKQDASSKLTPNKKLYSSNSLKSNTVKKIASKTLLSSHIAKNTKTIYTTKKHASVCIKENPTVKVEFDKLNQKNKKYLPLYLRRKIQSSIIKNNVNENNSENKVNTEPKNTRKVLSDLTKIPQKTFVRKMNYMIFRNDVRTDDDSNVQKPLGTEIIKTDSLDRSHSPQSQHSSTCSSLNSVATVRAVSTRNRVTCTRKISTSSARSSSGTLEAETKNKKFSRRSKICKKPPTLSTLMCDDKENVPQSSKNTISRNRDTETAKSVFLGKAKSIYMAQTTTETSALPLTTTNISKTEVQPLTKSLNLVNIRNFDDQRLGQPSSSIYQNNKNQENDEASSFIPDSKVLKYETFKESSLNNSFVSDISQNSNDSDDMSLNSQQSIHSTKSGIISAIRILIENQLNIPENISNRNDSDSETVILSRDEDYVTLQNNLSTVLPTVGTVNQISTESTSYLNNLQINCPSPINENYKNHNAEDLKTPGTESDAQSLKSFASLTTSKFSEYYLADNELDRTIPQLDESNNISCIQDIFERKELNTIPNMGGMLAIQAFSGFSVNETITGDQPDYVNLIDSETGSFTFESARQATSEEIFVSGRSSDTYESCYVEDDAYVPYWLFNMISQQQSVDEFEAETINLPLPMAIVEPDFDMNGNVMDPGIGVGAGAGDGRGMHSDHSQDSSGRGTSLSSSEISSGPQSEAVLIDPSNFMAQVDQMREPMNRPPNRPDASTVSNNEENNEENPSNQSRTPRSLINPVNIASDIDADVSSLETDALDSDNF